MTLFQKILIFYAVMAVISSLITWFLTHDKKRIRFLLTHDKKRIRTNSFPERLFGWRDMADKFPRRIAVFAFLTSSPIQVTGHGFSARSGYQGN
ncbi:putative inner membrane protein [Salmonella enterica subsp. enterica serovar Baildon str. R6-199]|nr:putative inner membrane protein [Salmonella enterica subsp. enterica serovar Baildon str. R6-199]